MATFRVGQRVRLVKRSGCVPSIPPSEWVPIGTEGTVVPHSGRFDLDGRMPEFNVSFDGDKYPVRGIEGYQLEPAYDGNVKTTWDECAWQPEGATA